MRQLPLEGAHTDNCSFSVKTTEIIGNTVGANCVRSLENDQYQRNFLVGNAVLSVPKIHNKSIYPYLINPQPYGQRFASLVRVRVAGGNL